MKRQGKVSSALLSRIKELSENESLPERLEYFNTYLVLKRIKATDDFEDSKTKPNKDGFFKTLYVKPEDDKRLVVLRNGSESIEYYDGLFWHSRHSNFTTDSPDMWKYDKF